MDEQTACVTASNTLFNRINWKNILHSKPTSNHVKNNSNDNTFTIKFQTTDVDNIKLNGILVSVMMDEYRDDGDDYVMITISLIHDDEIVDIPFISQNEPYELDYDYDDFVHRIKFIRDICNRHSEL